MKGPLLLACNHPNSFLDAILLDILFQKPIWSLARGDVFKKSFYVPLLTKLKILPVYRTSEGVENLTTNYKTFEECKNIFRNNGIVLMFSEGKCVNEWHLRPLKKGTARLAISSWEQNINLQVLPVGINYSSFNRFGKNIFLNFGTIITADEISSNDSDGKKHLDFNNRLQDELTQLVFEIPDRDKLSQEELLVIKPATLIKILLRIPSLLGLLLNSPLYLLIRYFVRAKAKGTDHYDSIMIALLVFFYPFYLLLVTFWLFIITHSYFSLLLLLILPFTAWSFVQIKQQLDK